jgi:hypothetical protein
VDEWEVDWFRVCFLRKLNDAGEVAVVILVKLLASCCLLSLLVVMVIDVSLNKRT